MEITSNMQGIPPFGHELSHGQTFSLSNKVRQTTSMIWNKSSVWFSLVYVMDFNLGENEGVSKN